MLISKKGGWNLNFPFSWNKGLFLLSGKETYIPSDCCVLLNRIRTKDRWSTIHARNSSLHRFMWLCLEDISRVDRYFHYTLQCLGFPGSSDSKEFACNTGDPSSIPGFGRSPGERNGNPLQYSCLENIMSEEPGRLQFWGSQRAGYDWPTNTHINLVFFYPPSLFVFIFNHWLSNASFFYVFVEISILFIHPSMND